MEGHFEFFYNSCASAGLLKKYKTGKYGEI